MLMQKRTFIRSFVVSCLLISLFILFAPRQSAVASPPSTEAIPVETMSPILVLILGGAVGLGLGGGLVFLLDMLDPKIRIFEDLDKLFKDQEIPLLGVVPELKPELGESLLITDINHPCAEIYERMRSNLQLSGAEINDGRIPTTVLVTSPVFHEGKTTTAFNLGIAAARTGRRTLIIEMDFRNPPQSLRFGIQPDEQALTEPLQYYSGRLSDPIRMVPGVANLSIAPGVGPQRSPAAILDSGEMRRFLKDAQARFDFVILDAPHFTSSNDVVLLEPKTDGLILVTRPGVTKKPIIKELLEQLEEKEDIRVLGGVINAADIPIKAAQMRNDTLVTEDDEDIEVNEATPPAAEKAPSRRTPVEF